MKNNKMKINKSKPMLVLVIALIIALVATCGFLAARFFIDNGHDILASHDTFDVKIVAQNSETGDLYNVNNGIITIENASGFESDKPLPITVDMYYKGESYAYIRFMMMEQWSGTYSEDVDGVADQNGILPEPLITLNLNKDIPMADNRAKDGYIYLTQVQTNLTDSEVDTNWKNQRNILNTKSSDEQMYMYENGKFVPSDDGEYKKLSIIKEGCALTPQFTDEADGVNSATVTTLKLYLEADAVQFNRFEKFWNITNIPNKTTD